MSGVCQMLKCSGKKKRGGPMPWHPKKIGTRARSQMTKMMQEADMGMAPYFTKSYTKTRVAQRMQLVPEYGLSMTTHQMWPADL